MVNSAISPRVLTFGETMILLDPDASGPLELSSRMQIRFAGAESNFAIGLARLGVPTEWVSRVGDDDFGRIILSTLADEGIDVQRCNVDAARSTGLFFKWREGPTTHRQYYRGGSAATGLAAEDVLPLNADWLHVTGITMSLSDSAAAAVRVAARHARTSGTKVSFDVNYRPSQWSDASAARTAALDVIPSADWVFCGIEEGQQVFGATDAHDLARILRESGASNSLIRVGSDGAYVTDGGTLQHVPIPELVADIADEIGAGDAFSAGFVYGQLDGKTATESAVLGHRLAARALAGTGDWETLPTSVELI
ncbi:sugar kinase [Rhodococcus koreensis]